MTAKIDLNLSNSATFTFFSSPSFFCLALTIFPPFFLPYNSGIFRLNKCNKHDYLALFQMAAICIATVYIFATVILKPIQLT